MQQNKSKYNEDDVVTVTMERGDSIIVTLGKPRKMYVDEKFIGWSYDSKTDGVNWIAEHWIN